MNRGIFIKKAALERAAVLPNFLLNHEKLYNAF